MQTDKQQSAVELKPCPFCGGEAEVREWDWPYTRFQCRCSKCKCQARARMANKADAIAAWNQRTDLANLAPEPVDALASVWQQARENHASYSATGDSEQDIRFFALGLAGEAGEVANFVKKRWRDGDGHDADLRAEVADVFAYNIMLADALGMSPADLIAEVARKQQVFIAKMQARTIKDNDHD